MAKDVLIRALPDVSDIRFTSPTNKKPTPGVEFETPYGWVPLRQRRYGYWTMIAWVVDLASRMVERYPDSDDSLAEPAVVWVDEIDLHLHPKWQRELIGFLSERFPNTQFIGLERARPPDMEKLLKRRKALLTKSRLTKATQKELEEIKDKLGQLPDGESFEQAKKTLNLVEQSLELIKKYQGTKS
jgi:predicted ATP-binding protein involved in virulence